MSEPSDEHIKYRLMLKLALANGFTCHVCDSTSFLLNGLGLAFCEECAVAYSIQALEKIYDK